MKRMMGVFLALVLTLGMCGAALSAAAATGSVSFTAGASSVTVGGSVTLTVTYTASSVGAGKADISYDNSLFQCTAVNGTGTHNQASAAGLLTYNFAENSQKSSHQFACTFKSKKAGTGTFTLSSDGLVTFDEEEFSVGDKSLTVSVANPAASSNANLASLKPSSGTLTPQFSANTTSYTISVPYTTTSLSLSAKAADSGAKVQVGGTNTLKLGKNTQTVTVTAPNGTQKTYTVVITRAADQGQGSGASGTTTAPSTPAGDVLKVEVDGREMTVADTQPDISLPEGFAWDSTDFDGIQVAAAKNEKSGLTLLYLRDSEAGQGALYLYDAESKSFTPFRPLTVTGGIYTLLDLPADMAAPTGTVAGEVTIGEQTVPAWLYEDTAQADFSVVYATAPDGRTGLYVYDSTDGSMQRYRTPVQPADTEPEQPAGNALTRFAAAHKTAILLGAAVLAGAALLVVAIVLLVMLLRKPDDCKH